MRQKKPQNHFKCIDSCLCRRCIEIITTSALVTTLIRQLNWKKLVELLGCRYDDVCRRQSIHVQGARCKVQYFRLRPQVSI